MLGTANAIGAIVASLVIGQMSHLRRRGLVAYFSLMISCVALIVYGLPLPHALEPLIASVASVCAGFGLGVFGVIWVTVLQEIVPSDKLGRVSSIDWLGSLALLPIGYALTGVLTDHIGPAWVFVGAGVMNLSLCLIALSARGIRELA